MRVNAEWDWQDWAVSLLLIVMMAGIPGGLFLTWWFEGGAWWIWTVISIIFFAAG